MEGIQRAGAPFQRRESSVCLGNGKSRGLGSLLRKLEAQLVSYSCKDLNGIVNSKIKLIFLSQVKD